MTCRPIGEEQVLLQGESKPGPVTQEELADVPPSGRATQVAHNHITGRRQEGDFVMFRQWH
eukprot:3107193-Prorocentrum_lima.AAC.1